MPEHRALVRSIILNSVLNICCSIVIVLLNKWIYVHIGFPNLTLTLLHFITTYIGLVICERCNVFQVKNAPLKYILPLVLSFCGFVIFTNLSLQYNTVGTYQLAKVMTTPTIVVLQETIYRKRVSVYVKLTLVLITTGVCLSIANDLKFHTVGVICAAIGVIITSFYQILVGVKQQELQMNPMQLLYYQAPLSSLILFLFIIVLEPPWTTLGMALSAADLVMVGLSCTTAFVLNLSIYWIIGQTSALTYNMVGHLKFCLTTAGGFFLFEEQLTIMQCFGVVLTLCGITAYSQLKSCEQRKVSSRVSIEDG